MTLFSIITPFYHGNQYIARIFALAQANRASVKEAIPDSEVELIIVNDSPECSVVVPPDADPALYRIITHKENGGIHRARITGFQESRGDYILFLDQDDEIAENYLSEQMKHMEGADCVVCGAYQEDANGKSRVYYDTKGKLEKITTVSTYLKSHNQIISPGQCLLRRDAIPHEWTEYVMSFNGSDDLFLWILMFAQQKKFAVNPECLYTHKYTGENLSASGLRMGASSLSFADTLRKIPYVPEKEIRALEKSRRMDLSMARTSGAGRLALAIKNADIIFHRIFWKLRSKK